MSTNVAFCPECEYRFKLSSRPHKGQRILCPECETNLVVASLNPVELEVAMFAKHSTPAEKKANAVIAYCTECDQPIKLGAHARQGQQVVCERCSTVLEVVSINPLELDISLTGIKGSRLKKAKNQEDFEQKADQEWN